ncbi:unnamed protein product [Caenorhabditis auriculariae]|uniref:E3 ubiquitin-protein ligase n=1 Tax=Caenorhabditis auriculariae TaxID=2777116 RepID=A0A8S1HPE4_9PELO|nr:unnamed protein product [Caenorhabditis auriculariae]
MPPGDLYDKSSANAIAAAENMDDGRTSSAHNEDVQKYQPSFTIDDWYVNKIMNYNDMEPDLKKVYEAAGYWKEIADRLRAADFPLFPGVSNTEKFNDALREDALKLDDFLDLLITKQSIQKEDLYKKLRLLIAQGDEYLKFKEKMKNLDFSLKCNEIWENDSVAYRCSTCALTPCMSLCAACFESNGHAGHDFTRFFSREGGACDCGNEDVIKPQGFCCKHGASALRHDTNFLDVSLPEFIYVKLLVRLFLEWRGWSDRFAEARIAREAAMETLQPTSVTSLSYHCDEDIKSARLLISFLQECVNYGGPMRESMARILLDKKLYEALTEKSSDHINSGAIIRADVSLDWRTRIHFENDVNSIKLSEERCKIFDIKEQDRLLKCSSLLDELVFWIIRQTFPQNLINFSLSMLSETEYRNELAVRFFNSYPMVANCINELCLYQNQHGRQADAVQGACSRVIHVSVQMLSSEALCKELNRKCNLVNTVFRATYFLLAERTDLTSMTLHPKLRFWDYENDFPKSESLTWRVMNIEQNASLSQHGYWFVMGDMQNLLSHASIAVDTVLHPVAFCETYTNLLCRMQGMNQSWRIISGHHREHDVSEPVQKAFTLEFETSAVTLFNIVSAIQSKKDTNAAIAFFDHILLVLKIWLDELRLYLSGDQDPEETTAPKDQIGACPAYTVSFHIPLHRHLSTAISHFYIFDEFRTHLVELLNDELTLRLLMLHPLRVQVARTEFNANMWVRNGNQLRAQVIIYTQPHINTAFQSPDIDLIRFCAANIDPDWLIEALLDNFLLSGNFHLPNRTGALVQVPVTNNENYSNNENNNEQPMEDEVDLIRDEAEGLNEDPHDEGNELEEAKPRVFFERKQVEISNPASSVENHRHPLVVMIGEWLDSMIHGMLKLLCELVVICVNCGEVDRKTYKAEVVNSLAMESMTHSRLRGCITEKGSRGNETIDPVFDNILAEVADFVEPDPTSGAMKQGNYKLKPEMWFEDFCPVFCMMRAAAPRYCSGVLADAVKRDKENASKWFPLDGVKLRSEVFWTPFRLVSFEKGVRHDSVSKIGRILVCDRFIQLSLCLLAEYTDDDLALQMTVYLLTLGVRYAMSIEDDEKRESALALFHKSYFVTKLKSNFSVFSFFRRVFLRKAEVSECKRVLIEKVLNGRFNAIRVCGGATVYFARFLAVLCSGDEVSRAILMDDLQQEMSLVATPVKDEEVEKKMEQRKKEERERRKAKVMASFNKNNKTVMAHLMDKEGMTQADVDHIDTSQPNVKLYECPICGDIDSPCTLDKPFCMLIKVSTNFAAENQVERSSEEKTLLEAEKENYSQKPNKTRRHWINVRKELANYHLLHSNLLENVTGVELKTCGHTSHVECFAKYRRSVQMADLRAQHDRYREIPCPLCRFPVNGVLPLTVDLGFETNSKGSFDDRHKAFTTLRGCVDNARKTFVKPQDEKSYRKHYGCEENGALSEIRLNRQRHDDAAERRISDSRCTNSSFFLAIVVATIERRMIFKKLEISERRKNTTSIVSEHLLASSVAVSVQHDENACIAALNELILQPNTIVRTSQTSLEGLLTVSDPDSDFGDGSDLMADERAALRSTSRSERVRRHSMSFESLGPLTPVTQQVPLLLYEPRSLLTRLSAYVIDNRSLSKEDKTQLCKVLAGYIVGMAAVRATLRLLLRGGSRRLRRLAKGQQSVIPGLDKTISDLPRQISTNLSSSEPFFTSVLLVGIDESEEPAMIDDDDVDFERFDDAHFARELNFYLVELLRFICELWSESGLISREVPDGDIPLREALKAVGLDTSCLRNSPDQVSRYDQMYAFF